MRIQVQELTQGCGEWCACLFDRFGQRIHSEKSTVSADDAMEKLEDEVKRRVRAHAINWGMPTRVWINQPSELQEDHRLHGKVGIAVPEKYDTPESSFTTIHFAEGEVRSMRIAKLSLSLCGGG